MAVKKEEKTFEESLVELESIVKELEGGNVDLDKAIEKYSEAMKLAKTCSDKLNNATEKENYTVVYSTSKPSTGDHGDMFEQVTENFRGF